MTRRTIYLFIALMLTAVTSWAQFLPTFSTPDAPVWHVVQFKAGGACLADQGAGSNLKTAAKNATDPAQRWMLVGDRSGFKMKSEKGNYVGYSSKFITTTESKAATLKLSANGDYWEIQRSTSQSSMNQWGGTGAGRELGEWTAGDPNNPLQFIVASAVVPKFSTDDDETWYFLQFCRDGHTIESKGLDKNCLLAVVDLNDNQLWKLVGDKENFTLVCKGGGSAYLNNNFMQTSTTNQTNFRLTETSYAAYAPNWEIQPLSGGTYASLNQYQGTSVGNRISTWNEGDINNPIKFIEAASMEFDDYSVTGSTNYRPENKRTLWYTQPATLTGVENKWMEYSLPIGNGQLGASLFGGVQTDQILFNEKTLWSGSNGMSGNYTHYGDGIIYGSYQLFGNLFAHSLDGFGYSSQSSVLDYVRTLDLDNAIGTVQFTSPDGAVKYNREYFVSYPDGAIVAHYTASESGKVNLRFDMESGKPGVVATTSYADGRGRFSGKLNTVSYAAEFRVVPTGGTMTTATDGVTVRDADEVTVVLVARTDYDAYSKTYVSGTKELVPNVTAAVDAASAKGYAELKEAHVADFTALMGRVSFDLDGQNTVPTNKLVDQYTSVAGTSSKALMLEELYYHYGRYLSISSSRGVDLPNNLQGIWCGNSTPPWHSDIHANINVQMNYWPCLAGNMAEMNEKFTNYIWNMACNHGEWAYNAKQYAAQKQTVGWTLFTENNIFGGGSTFQTNYVIANAWYCTHLWQHYRYTLDRDYLAQKALPAMWSCCEYWMERLVKGSDGTWECPNEYSPEQGPGSQNATAHSQQLVADLFANTLAAIDVLGEDNVNIKASKIVALRDKYAKLDKGLAIETYDGKWGTDRINSGAKLLREWKYSPYSVGEHNHRHMSHLMCLYPLTQLTPASGELFNAAINSMKLRGDASTGWSMGWKINLWARALDGTRAHSVLHTALRHSTSYGTNQGAGGIYYNLYDSHSPFQIDGNFGACAGIMEMLLQSHTDTICLLPALPSAWRKGEMNGLKAVGNYTVDQKWYSGKLTQATIVAANEGPCAIRYKSLPGRMVRVNGQEVTYRVADATTIVVELKAGDVLTIHMDEVATALPAIEAQEDVTVSVSSGRVTVCGGIDPLSVNICDVVGRMLASGHQRQYVVVPQWPDLVIVGVSDARGRSASCKLAVR